MNECVYDLPWYGPCGKQTEAIFCSNHIDRRCTICNNQAVKDCSVASSLTCGAPLCEAEQCMDVHLKRHYGDPADFVEFQPEQRAEIERRAKGC